MDQKNNSIKHITSCGALVYRLGKDIESTEVLLIKQTEKSPEWGIPKGKMSPGETHEQCAVREVFEETGVSIQLESRMKSVSLYHKKKIKTVISFLAKQVCDKEPDHRHPASEVCAAQWFRLDSLPPIQAYQENIFFEAKHFFESELGIRKTIDPYQEIKNALKEVHSYASQEDEWTTIKKELLKSLPPQARTFFSTRDQLTKQQVMNNFEIQVAQLWSLMTSRPVVFKNEKIYAPRLS